MTRIITVFGATGTQGSSVVNALLAEGTFQLRAVSRNPGSAASQELISRGVQVVKGDLWDRASLVKTIEGSECVFGVTNAWDPSVMAKPGGEVEQGVNLIEASKEAGVKFFVWSTVEDYKLRSNGKYSEVHHIQNKVEVDAYLKASGLPFALVQTGWFAENLWNLSVLTQDPSDHQYRLDIPCYKPDSPQAITCIGHDFGPSVRALVKSYNQKDGIKIVGQTFHVVSEIIESYTKLSEVIAQAIEKRVVFTSPSTSGITEFDDMYRYQSEIGMYSDVEVPDPRLVQLGVQFATMKEFVETEVKPRLM